MCFTNSLHHLQWAASAVLGQEVACSPAWRGLARSKQGYASQYANRGCNTTLLRNSFLNGRESPSTALFFAVLLAPTTAKQVVIRKSALGFCFFLSEKKWNYSFHSLNLLLPFFFFFHVCLYTGIFYAVSGVLCECECIATTMFTNWTEEPLFSTIFEHFNSGFPPLESKE